MANHDHFFMVNGDKSIHLHSPDDTPYEIGVNDDGALNVTNGNTGESMPIGSGGGGIQWIVQNDSGYIAVGTPEVNQTISRDKFFEMLRSGIVFCDVGTLNDAYESIQTCKMVVGYHTNATTETILLGGGSTLDVKFKDA